MCILIELLNSEVIWAAISAIATVYIGFLAYKISKKQYEIEIFKREDFKFEHKLGLFSKLSHNISDFLANSKVSHIGYMQHNNRGDEALNSLLELGGNFTRLKQEALILFPHEEIKSHLDTLQLYMQDSILATTAICGNGIIPHMLGLGQAPSTKEEGTRILQEKNNQLKKDFENFFFKNFEKFLKF